MRDDALFAHASALEPVWETAFHRLASCRQLFYVRNLGLVAKIEFAPLRATGEDAIELFRRLRVCELLARAIGDITALLPPLTVDEAQIEIIVAAVSTQLAHIDWCLYDRSSAASGQSELR